MKNGLFAATSALALVIAMPLAAQEVTGSSVTLSHYTGKKFASFPTTQLKAQVAFDVTQKAGVQVDLGVEQFTFGTTFGANLHGYYHSSDMLTLGAFAGFARSGFFSHANFGIEAEYKTDKLEVEAHIGQTRISSAGGIILGNPNSLFWGLEGRYAITDKIDLNAELGSIVYTGFFAQTRYQLSLGGTYHVTDRVSLFARADLPYTSIGGNTAAGPATATIGVKFMPTAEPEVFNLRTFNPTKKLEF